MKAITSFFKDSFNSSSSSIITTSTTNDTTIERNHHGNHVLVDLIWDVEKENLSENELANNLFNIIENAINKTSMITTFSKVCILGQTEDNNNITNITSPPGFTIIFGLDESHCSAHSYTDRGWLALDCFTCGKTDCEALMNDILNNIKLLYPSFQCTYHKNHKRFHYYTS